MKMKKIFLIILTAFAITSCGNDWLDVAEPHNGSVTPNIMYADEAAVTNAIVGSIDLMKEYYYDRHVTVGYRFYYLGLDFMGNDIVSNPGQWWTYEAQWHPLISSATGYQSSYYWAMFYEVINDVNTKIAGIQECSLSDSFKAASIAELKAIRAYSYFNLARVFQFSYAHAGENAPCVPLYTTPTTAETKGNDRASMKEVFTLIMEDLNEAVNTLDESRAAIFRINKNVALLWRANVNLEMQNWSAAAADAKAARAGYTLMNSKTYRSTGFNDINGAGEWIWGFPIQSDQAMGYASLFSHVDIFRKQNGYKNFFINETFVSKFSASDMRNVFIDVSYAFPSWGKWGAAKFQDNADACGDYGMHRASEMYLVEAEALVQSGKEADGHAVLFELQSHRDPLAVKSGNTGDKLIEEILLERRKELYGEIGTEFFDLKRYNKPLVRDGNHPISAKITVPAGDGRWLFQIHQSEYDRNPNISTQNKR